MGFCKRLVIQSNLHRQSSLTNIHIQTTVNLIQMKAKASKGVQPGFYWKKNHLTTVLKNHLTKAYLDTSEVKIVPLVVRIYSTGFVKCFDIAVFCSFWISPVSCESNKKNNNTFYCFKYILQSFWRLLTIYTNAKQRSPPYSSHRPYISWLKE